MFKNHINLLLIESIQHILKMLKCTIIFPCTFHDYKYDLKFFVSTEWQSSIVLLNWIANSYYLEIWISSVADNEYDQI